MLGGVAIIILVLGLFVQTNQGKKTVLSNYFHLTPIGTSPTAIPLKTMKVGNTQISVILADNDATRSKGLGGITNLPANEGMLFVFNSKQIMPSFWMKDMQIPLDFIWISNNKVSEITANVPPPAKNAPDNSLSIYKPNEPIDLVLEVNAGFTIKNSIKIGDTVTLP